MNMTEASQNRYLYLTLLYSIYTNEMNYSLICKRLERTSHLVLNNYVVLLKPNFNVYAPIQEGIKNQ